MSLEVPEDLRNGDLVNAKSLETLVDAVEDGLVVHEFEGSSSDGSLGGALQPLAEQLSLRLVQGVAIIDEAPLYIQLESDDLGSESLEVLAEDPRLLLVPLEVSPLQLDLGAAHSELEPVP